MAIDFAEILKEKFGEKVDEARIDRDHMEQIIKEQDIYFIENQKGMLVRRLDQDWTTVPAFCKHYGILNIKDFEMLLRVMDRAMTRVVNTFGHYNNKCELNLMTKENWIDKSYIIKGELKPLTLALLCSLAGGNAQAMDHIRHWVGWKYLHPEDISLPALSIYGAQNVGKGIFTNRILPTIFGKRQVFQAHSEDIVGTFNAHAVIGKTIVCVDESNLSKKTDDRLKQLIANPTIQAHPKGLTPITVDNCISYVFTSNDLFGGMRLDSDPDSNRRYSMIEADETLQHWTDQFGIDWKKMIKNRDIEKNFTDPVEMGKFLYDCIEIAKKEGAPEALHQTNYIEMVVTQHPINEFFEDVFIQDQMKWIPNENFLASYQEWQLRFDPGGFPPNSARLTREVKRWARKNCPKLKTTSRKLAGKTVRGIEVE